MPIMLPVLIAGTAGASLLGLGDRASQAGCETAPLEVPAPTADTSSVRVQQDTADAARCAEVSAAEGPRGSGSLEGLAAVAYADAQIGTPYQWGGERAGVGFDCSGLAQAAWSAAGVTIPRVAQDQYDAGPQLLPGEALEPGDLVFFGASTSDVTHVGIVVNPAGEMVDAPHTGALVRLDRFPIIPGSRWGGEVLVGATRPGGA